MPSMCCVIHRINLLFVFLLDDSAPELETWSQITFIHREIWTDDHANELSRIPNHNRMSNQWRHLQLVLDWLRSHELSAAGFDQVLLSVGNTQEALSIDVADVASLEPVALECVRSLLRILPIALEDRRTADPEFPVFGNMAFNVGKRLANGSQFVRLGLVDGNYGRCLSESVSLENANSHIGVPAGQIDAERSATRNVHLDASAEPLTGR